MHKYKQLMHHDGFTFSPCRGMAEMEGNQGAHMLLVTMEQIA